MSSLPPSNRSSIHVETRSPEETRRVAAAVSPILVPGDVILMSGDLGAGKTTFVQGLAAGLKVPERVTSPTFILVKDYSGGRYPLMHIDIYRLEKVQDVLDLGFDELLDPDHIVVVEWGDAVEPLLPKDHLLVELRYGEIETTRHLEITAKGPNWMHRFDTVRILTSELFALDRDHDFGFGREESPGEDG